MSDVLTAAMIKKAIRTLREADRRASEENRCSYCGERRDLHIEVHPNADPEMVRIYLSGGGAFCPPGPNQMNNPIHSSGLIPPVPDDLVEPDRVE
jgi:hypothetical protein